MNCIHFIHLCLFLRVIVTDAFHLLSGFFLRNKGLACCKHIVLPNPSEISFNFPFFLFWIFIRWSVATVTLHRIKLIGLLKVAGRSFMITDSFYSVQFSVFFFSLSFDRYKYQISPTDWGYRLPTQVSAKSSTNCEGGAPVPFLQPSTEPLTISSGDLRPDLLGTTMMVAPAT